MALAALDARVYLTGPGGDRALPLTELHRLPGDHPEVDTVLEPRELITARRAARTPVRRALDVPQSA